MLWFTEWFLAALIPYKSSRLNNDESVLDTQKLMKKFGLDPCSEHSPLLHLKSGSFEYLGEGHHNDFTYFPIWKVCYVFIPLTNINHLFVHWDLTDGYCFTYKFCNTVGEAHPNGLYRKFIIISAIIVPIVKPIKSYTSRKIKKKAKPTINNVTHISVLHTEIRLNSPTWWLNRIRCFVFSTGCVASLTLTNAILNFAHFYSHYLYQRYYPFRK